MQKSITVKAAREKVWDAIVSYRNSDPSMRKVVSSGDGKAVIEETFAGAPVVGSTKVVYEELETPPEQIEFKLVKADLISKFQGCWKLSEASGGSSTVIDLTAELDVGLSVPFKEQILNSQAAADIDKRLAYVKKQVEK